MKKSNRILSAPYNVDLMITRHCNLHCLHCCATPEQLLREDMSKKELLSIIDELAACKVFNICLTGGEPLSHPDFLQIANAVEQYPITLQINTNATLVTPKILDGFKKLPRKPFFSVSLDGTSSETYDRLRGPGSFDLMSKGIQMLVNAGFNVRPLVVVSKLNYHELPEIAKFADFLGVRQVFVSTPVACGRAKYYQTDMLLELDDKRKLIESILDIEAQYPNLLTGPWHTLASIYRAGQKTQWPKEFLSNSRFINCGGGITSIVIASDGTVTPCQLAYLCRAGNVRDKSFIDIWRNSEILNQIRECYGMPLKDISGCEDCSWHHICHGPCPADGFNENNVWPSNGTLCECLKDICQLCNN